MTTRDRGDRYGPMEWAQHFSNASCLFCAFQVRRVPRAHEALPVFLVHLEAREQSVVPDHPDLWDRWVRRESPEEEATKDHRDLEAIQVCMLHRTARSQS